MKYKQNVYGNLSFICGILGSLILIFLILPSVVGINLIPNFERIIVLSGLLLGIAAITFSQLQIDKNKITKTGLILGIIICIIDLPLAIIVMFSG